MGKKNNRELRQLEQARALSELWDELEQEMGEQAAYCVACEKLGFSEERGYELLSMLNTEAPI